MESFYYDQIMITPKDKYKAFSITTWGAFVWLVMAFGLKKTPLTYQRVGNWFFHNKVWHVHEVFSI